jgi:transcriptional regulator with XRE-family HTH domain
MYMPNEKKVKIEFCDAIQFGELIRGQRKKIGLRIDDAALLCGVSVALLSGLENASRPVGLPKALHIAHQLGITLFAEPKQIKN